MSKTTNPAPRKRGLAAYIRSIVRGVLREDTPRKRAKSASDVYYMLWDELEDRGHWLFDIYFEGNESFAVTSSNGKLYCVAFTETDNGVEIGEITQVVMQFTPVAADTDAVEQQRVKTRFIVKRMADGSARWIAQSSAAVLNRVGEIDAMALFDSMIQHSEDTGRYPFLTFYHAGLALRFGTCDFSMRDGYLLIQSGTFDLDGDNADLAEVAIAALERGDQEWGVSIGFYPTKEAEIIRVSGIEIPVYTSGIQIELSLVLERDAASELTSFGLSSTERDMSDALKKKLMALTGDEALAEEFSNRVDEQNRTVEREGMITRGTDPDDDLKDEDDPEDTSDIEIEFTDELLEEVTQSVLGNEVITQLTARFATLEQLVTAQAQTIEAQQKRIAALERDDTEKLDEIKQDEPRTRRKVVFRPSQTRQTEQPKQSVEDDNKVIPDALVPKFEGHALNSL